MVIIGLGLYGIYKSWILFETQGIEALPKLKFCVSYAFSPLYIYMSLKHKI